MKLVAMEKFCLLDNAKSEKRAVKASKAPKPFITLIKFLRVEKHFIFC